jgi:RNA-binding protein YhbY
MSKIKQLQLGKNGLTNEFIESLKHQFDNTKTIKISVLKSAERKSMDEYAKKMIEHLGNKFTYKIIGFTIILKKWNKEFLNQNEKDMKKGV